MNDNSVMMQSGAMGGRLTLEEAFPEMKRARDAQEERTRRLNVLAAVWQYDDNEEARALVDGDGRYWFYGSPFARNDNNLDVYGQDCAEVVAPELAGSPLELCERAIAGLPEERRKVYQDAYNALYASGNDTKRDWYGLYGQMVRDGVLERVAEHKRKTEEMQAEIAAMPGMMEKELPAYVAGGELSAELAERLGKYGQMEAIRPSLERGRAAFEYMRDLQHGGDEGEYDAKVANEVGRLKDEYYGHWHFMPERKSEEDFIQQAKANVGGSYEVGRGEMRVLADLLTDEKGVLDKQALGAVLLALDADAQGQQTIDGAFVRNMMEGMKRMGMETVDYVNRGNAQAGFIWQGADMNPVYLTQEQQDDFADLYGERVETLKNELAKLEDRRLTASEKASMYARFVTPLGSMVGGNVPFLATAPVGGWMGMAAGAAAMFPSMANRSVAQAYAEGEAHPELVGNVIGAAQVGAEGMFGRLAGGNKLVAGLLDKAAAKTLGVPALGKALGTIQGNGLLRFAAGVAGESAGELFVEDTVADGVSCLTLGGLRKLGVDIDEREFEGFAPAWEAFKGDPYQSAATVAYCAVMGLLGVGGTSRQAREFAVNVENSLAAGLKPGTARRLSALAQSEAVTGEELMREARMAYDEEVLNGDPVELKKRLEAAGKRFLEQAEVAMYARSGVRDYVLQQAGILAPEQNADGSYKVTREVARGDGESESVESNWAEEQLDAYVSMRAEDLTVRAMREFQARLQGAALAGAVQTDEERVKGEILSLRELPTEAVAVMQKNGGRINYEVLEAMGNEARRKVEGFVDEGLGWDEAAARESAVPGVSLGVLMRAARSFGARVDAMVGTAEGKALGIRARGDASTAMFRLDGMGPGQSVLLYNAGAVSEREVVEDLIERDLVAAMREPGALGQLGNLLREVERCVRRYDRKARFLPEKEELSDQDVVEGFSTLAQSRFLLNHARYKMPQEAHDSIEYVQKRLADAQHLVALSHAWDAFAQSEEGKAFIAERGASLERLMEDAGASVAGRYAAAKLNADVFEVVRAAYEEATSPELAGGLHEEYEAEQRELDHPLPPVAPEPIPAEESITGEEVSSEEQMGGWLFDAGSGLMPPSGEVQQGGPGRGLVNGEFVRMTDGSVYGVAEVDGIGLSADVPQFKKKEGLAGREAADEDGTTHELSGGWNAKTDAIIVWRRSDGRLEVISGRHRLAHARKNGVKHIAVRVYDEDAEHDAAWAKLYDVEVNILANTCNAIDVAYYFRHNPMSLGEAEARGLMPKTRAGEQTAASRMGIEIAAAASDDTFTALINGVYSAEDVHMACVIASSPEGQALALTERQGVKGKKQSWEYVTALVRGSEQMSGGGAMLDLFGWDTGFKEKAQKMARYVEAARAQLKQRISVLASAGVLQRRADVAKREGVRAERPKDAVERIAKLAALDAAYERMDAALGISAKADAWDGKSVPVVDEEALVGAGASFSVFSPAEASGLKALRSLAQGAKEARFRSDTLGADVVLPLGNAGALKNPDNPKSDVKGAHGFMHLITMRMAHGESLDEAAYTSSKAIMAVVNGEIAQEKQRGKTLTLDGYNGVIKANWQDSENAWVITGYKKNGEKSGADDRRRALSLAASYAPDSFGGLKEVGAALDYAIARLAREYKQNHADPRRKVANRHNAPALSLTDAKERGLFKDGVMETGNAVITEPGASFSIEGVQHASPHKFKKFDLAHIGSGEGNQAFGWGVYFSEAWGTNKEYFKAFSNGTDVFSSNKGDVEAKEVLKVLKKYNADANERTAVNFIPESIDEYDRRIKAAKRAIKLKEYLRDEKIVRGRADGRNVFLRNGEEISYRDVMVVFRDFGFDFGYMDFFVRKDVADYDNTIERERSSIKESRELKRKGIVKAKAMNYLSDLEVEENELLDWDEKKNCSGTIGGKFNRSVGRKIYEDLVKEHGSQKAASEWLLARGIKGIRYADAATRSKDAKKTYNYVIFDPSVICIRKVAERKPWSRDVEDAATWQGYEGWASSWSLRGQASVLDRVSLRELAQEEAVVRLMNRARRGINRWRRVFAGDEAGAAAAAQALGEAGSVMEAALQYLPAGKRPHYARQMQLVEAYARVIETGRVRKMNKEAKSEGAKLRQELLNEVFDELGKVQGLKGEALREVRGHFTRQVAERRLEDVAIGMVESAVAAMERYLVEQEVGKLERLAERLAPRKLPNGKLAKGKMSANAYREFVRLLGMVKMTAEARDARMKELQAEMAAADAVRAEAIEDELKELVMYGALGEAGLVQARRGVAALVEFARTERARWKEAAELERARAKRLARLATKAMGGVSEQKAAEQKDAESKFAGTVGAMFKGFESLGQMWMGMENVPALGGLARWSLDSLSRGNVQLAMREHVWREKERRWMEEELGLDTEGKRNDWMARLKRVEDSGVKRAGELRRHRVRLTVDEAREVAGMTKREREERNERLRRAAEARGVDAENVVGDEDAALLRKELAKMPEAGRGQYVQTEREWRDEAGRETMKLSRDEALNILLLCEQAGYAEAADEHGFTPEALDGLRKFVGEDALRYGYFLRDALDGNGLADVYEAREGVPFPKVENYWPGRFDQSSRVNESASALDNPAGNGTAYGMLMTRVQHKLRFDQSIGATNSFRAAMAQQNNYIVMGELTRRWRKMLAHADFALAMKNHMGDAQFKTFKGLLNLVDGQGAQIAATEALSSRLVRMMQSAHAMAVLSGAVPTLIKQTSAILNGTVYGGVGMWELLREVGRPGAASLADIAGLDCIKARFAGEEEYERMQKMGRNVGWSRSAVLARLGMDLIGKADVWMNMVSMRALYNATYRRMKQRQEGAADALSEAEIRQECERVVQNALELGAQPLRDTQKAANLALGRSATMRVLGYMGSDTFNKVGAAIATYQRNGGGVRGFWAAMKYVAGMSTAMQVAMMVVQLMRGDSPATGEDDEWVSWLLTNALTGLSGAALLQGVPILGEAVAAATGDYVRTGTYGQQLYDYQGAWRSTKKLWGALSGGKKLDNGELAWQLVQELRYATFLTGLGGGVNAAGWMAELAGAMQSVNAAGNLVRPAVQYARNVERHG